MNKKFFAIVLCVFFAGFLTAGESESIDLVIMMDTSSSMHSSYKELSEYVVGPLLREFLRLDDTFHLISFSGSPHAELSRRIEGSGDVETIIGRMLLMYPLDPYSDVLAALEYAGRYLADLPDTRAKTLILISDGEHAPPPSSPYAGKDSVALEKKLSDTTARLKGNGWTFYFLRVPHGGSIPKLQTNRPRQTALKSNKTIVETKNDEKNTIFNKTLNTDTTNLSQGANTENNAVNGDTDERVGSENPESSGKTSGLDVSDAVSELLAAPIVDWETGKEGAELNATLGSIVVEFPSDIGKTDRSLRIPLSVKNPSPDKVYLETNSILVNGKESMAKRTFKELKGRSEGRLDLMVTLPDDMQSGQTSITIEPKFSGSVRISPQSGQVSFMLVEKPFNKFFISILPIIFIFCGLGLAVLLALFIIMLMRRLTKSPAGTLAASYHETKSSPENIEKHALSNASRTVDSVANIPQPSARDDASLLSAFAQQTSGDRNAGKAEIKKTSLLLKSGSKDGGSVQASMAGTSTAFSVAAPPYIVHKAEARIMLSLFVEDQNTAIGRRNVHLLKAGATLSLGGGRSDFLVFLVPLPQHIADIRFDGETCIFVPRRAEYFPDLHGEVMQDCVGKTIRILSKKEYELKIRFDKFKDPLEQLNKFLHSIDVPGRN